MEQSCRLVRLVRKRILYRLQIKEGAQRNVEIAYCNCKVPFWVGDSLHAFSSKLVRLMLWSDSGELVRLVPGIARLRLPNTIVNKGKMRI
jgi:hypothetical protein